MSGDAQMTAAHWNARYRAEPDLWTKEPNAPLARFAGELEPGRALDVGAGDGRNAIWLATQGWAVTAIDLSAVALERAAERAAARGTQLECVVADWHEHAFEEAAFELVVVSFMHPQPEDREALFERQAARLTVTFAAIRLADLNTRRGCCRRRAASGGDDVAPSTRLGHRRVCRLSRTAPVVGRRVAVTGCRAGAIGTTKRIPCGETRLSSLTTGVVMVCPPSYVPVSATETHPWVEIHAPVAGRWWHGSRSYPLDLPWPQNSSRGCADRCGSVPLVEHIGVWASFCQCIKAGCLVGVRRRGPLPERARQVALHAIHSGPSRHAQARGCGALTCRVGGSTLRGRSLS